MKNKFIIIGSYSPNTLGQIRSLGEIGITPVVVLIKKNTFRIDKSKYMKELHNFDDIYSALDYVVNTFGNEAQKPFIYTDRDDLVGLMNERYDELKDKFHFWNAGEQGRLNFYLDKRNQIKLAEACGMKAPKTEVVKVGELPKTLSYPIFTKAVDSLNPFWKGNSFICHNEQELQAAYRKMDIEYILLQEYIDKKDEMPVVGISINNGTDICFFGKFGSYRIPANGFGIYRYLEKFEDPVFEEKIRHYFKAIHYNGIFGFDNIIDKKGNIFFLESNFRIAQYNYAFTKYGINLPLIYAKSIIQGHIATELIKPTTKRVSLMSEFEDFKESVLHGDLTLRQWLKDFRKTDCFYFYNTNDNAPFYYTILAKLINSIKQKLHIK